MAPTNPRPENSQYCDEARYNLADRGCLPASPWKLKMPKGDTLIYVDCMAEIRQRIDAADEVLKSVTATEGDDVLTRRGAQKSGSSSVSLSRQPNEESA